MYRNGRDRMVVGFITTYAISAYYYEQTVRIPLKRGVLDTTLCHHVSQ